MATNNQRESAFDPEALYQQLLQAGDRPRVAEDEVHLTVDEILDYAFERLSSEDVARIDAHLDSGCEDCLDDMESVLELVSPWVGPVSATPELLAALSDQLGDPVWYARLSAASVVAAIGPVAATARILKGLLAMLEDERPWVRDGAIEAFERLGDRAATPEVKQALEGLLALATDAQIRGAALQVVTAISVPAGGKPDKVLGMRDDTSSHRGIVRYRATAGRLASLIEPLSSAEVLVREAAVETVAELGAAAAAPMFLSSLVQILQSGSQEARAAAAYALVAIGPAAATPEVVAALSEVLDSTDESARDLALFTLDALGPAAEPLAPASAEASGRHANVVRLSPGRITSSSSAATHTRQEFRAAAASGGQKPRALPETAGGKTPLGEAEGAKGKCSFYAIGDAVFVAFDGDVAPARIFLRGLETEAYRLSPRPDADGHYEVVGVKTADVAQFLALRRKLRW